MLRVALEDDYLLLEAENGARAIEQLKEHENEICAVLLDIIMPQMDGYGVLKYMRERELLAKIPVLIISGESGSGAERECLRMGAVDFIHKPFDREVICARVWNIIELFAYKNHLEVSVRQKTEELHAKNELLEQQAARLKAINEKIIDALGTVVEYRNLESGEHIFRVKGFTKILAEHAAVRYPEYGLTPEKITVIVSAAAMHDIGKISISDSVLLKPGRLTDEEYEYMKTHTTQGCELLDQITDIWSEEYQVVCREICRWHHERYDGGGYPDGLVGESIPISAQLVSIADVYDALVSERCYKKAIDKDVAFQMILDGKCGVFSPKLLECFIEARSEFEAMVKPGV